MRHPARRTVPRDAHYSRNIGGPARGHKCLAAQNLCA